MPEYCPLPGIFVAEVVEEDHLIATKNLQMCLTQFVRPEDANGLQSGTMGCHKSRSSAIMNLVPRNKASWRVWKTLLLLLNRRVISNKSQPLKAMLEGSALERLQACANLQEELLLFVHHNRSGMCSAYNLQR